MFFIKTKFHWLCSFTNSRISMLFILGLGCLGSLVAQPQPCINPAMTPTCSQACVICDIDGFSGINNSTQTGIPPNDFCTTEAHNINWIAFVAGSQDLTLEVSVTNCQTNLGLEIGIYESLDCDLSNMSQVTFCDTDIPENDIGIFSNNVPLIVGQYYYFVMDGSNGDICNYAITVTEGTTAIGVLNPSSGIVGPTEACPGATQTFSVEEQIGANFTNWYLDGNLIYNGGEILEHTWGPDEGTFELCYQAFNVCDTIPLVCTTVILENPPEINYVEHLCTGECFTLSEFDTMICQTGFYSFSEPNIEGCNQVITLDLTISDPVYTPLDLQFCFGDTIFIGNQAYTQTGYYEISLETEVACDSIVQLDLLTFLCDIEGGFADDSLSCYEGTDASLEFNLVDGVFPYTFEWEEVTGSNLSGNGVSDSSTGQILIPNLPTGIYSITVTDASGSLGVFVGQVYEPEPMTATFNYSDYSGFGVTCHSDENGTLQVMVDNALSPYDYAWITGDSTAFIDSLASGYYSVTVTDANNCQGVFNAFVSEPDPLDANASITEPGCNPDDSGIISLENTTGGIPPYLFDLDMNGFSTDSVFPSLFPGDYQLSILDANDCIIELDVNLAEPNILVLDLGEDPTIFLGDSIQIEPFTNLFGVEFQWEDRLGISCLDCRTPFVRPFQTTTYVSTATMSNGCFQTDSITIFMETRRNFFIPNVFTPNADGVNDFLEVFGGLEVRQVLEMDVFSRWGELVYSEKNLLVNQMNQGWDGNIKGQPAHSAVYVWVAKVEFLDGEILSFNGDVSLVR